MKQYDKLVRDLIPEVIEMSGKSVEYEVVDKVLGYQYLLRKLEEEVLEFKQDQNLEELADILEVIISLANKLGYSETELLTLRKQKKAKRGGFEKNIVLKCVKEN